jgi:chromosome segregation ATPase
MAQESGKIRYSVALSSDLASLLKEQAATEGKSLSAFLAHIVEERYAEKKTLAGYGHEMEALQSNSEKALQLQRAEYEKQAQNQRAESANIVQRVRAEHEKKIEQLIAEHDAEIQQIRADGEKQMRQLKADRSASIQQLENSLEELESVTQKLDANLKESGERNRALMEQLRESEAAHQTVVIDLQHRVELIEKDKASLEAALQVEKGHSLELKADKGTLQKQVELLTLRLPAQGRFLVSDIRPEKRKPLSRK